MKYLLSFAFLLATPVVAQVGALSVPAPVVTAQVDPDKLICKKQVVIGSLIAKRRVCATARNWERNEALAKEHLDILTAPGHTGGIR